MIFTRRKMLFLLTLCVVFSQTVLADTLFIGRDTEDFAGTLPDHLIKATVTGAAFNSQLDIPLDFHLNGLGDGPGFLYTGTAINSTHITNIDYNGNIVGGFDAPIPTTCCNEEMQLVGNILYHAHYNNEIEQLDPNTGAAVGAPLPQSDVVGLANVNGLVWLTKWAGRSVGVWDPLTNIYTEAFSTDVAGRNPGQNTGALAFDPTNQILWIGFNQGDVVPYDLLGNKLNAGFKPFGIMADTIDGLTFQGEGSQPAPVPEPGTLLMLGSGMLAGIRFLKRKIS